MNLFFLDFSPVLAAMMYCDQHVVKIILEATQMLYTAHHVLQKDKQWMKEAPSGGYKKAFTNNPVCVWVRSNRCNYNWTTSHLGALLDEYKKRYNNRTHQCEVHHEWLKANEPPGIPDATTISEPWCAMPEIYKVKGDPVASYRKYFLGTKASFARYFYTPVPQWIIDAGVEVSCSRKAKTKRNKKFDEKESDADDSNSSEEKISVLSEFKPKKRRIVRKHRLHSIKDEAGLQSTTESIETEETIVFFNKTQQDETDDRKIYPLRPRKNRKI